MPRVQGSPQRTQQRQCTNLMSHLRYCVTVILLPVVVIILYKILFFCTSTDYRERTNQENESYIISAETISP